MFLFYGVSIWCMAYVYASWNFWAFWINLRSSESAFGVFKRCFWSSVTFWKTLENNGLSCSFNLPSQRCPERLCKSHTIPPLQNPYHTRNFQLVQESYQSASKGLWGSLRTFDLTFVPLCVILSMSGFMSVCVLWIPLRSLWAPLKKTLRKDLTIPIRFDIIITELIEKPSGEPMI